MILPDIMLSITRSTSENSLTHFQSMKRIKRNTRIENRRESIKKIFNI